MVRFHTLPGLALPASASAEETCGAGTHSQPQWPWARASRSIRGGGEARKQPSVGDFEFGRTGRKNPVLGGLAKVAVSSTGSELWNVRKIKPDGKCMFRAMAYGMSMNRGRFLSAAEEEVAANELRLACHAVLCKSDEKRKQYKPAMKQLKAEGETLPTYCKKMLSPSFWGGEVEMLVLAQMLKVPIRVYLSESETAGDGIGFTCISTFGDQYARADAKTGRKGRRPVRMLFRDGNHFDLLL